MNKRTLTVLAVITTAILLGGCSTYNKLIKSGDKELMYTKALEFFERGKYQKTLQLFEEIAHQYMGTAQEDTIAYYTGSAYYKMGDFESSGLVFDDFRRRFGRSPFLEDVEYMYAMGYYFISPSAEREQTITLKAISAIREYMERYPNSIKKELCQLRVDELTGRLYDKAYINARTYYKIGRHKSAIIALKNALTRYPDTPHREDILYLTVKSHYELASNSIASLQKDRYLDMLDAYYTFASEFPQSKHIKELDRLQQTAKRFIAKNEPVEEEEGVTSISNDIQTK